MKTFSLLFCKLNKIPFLIQPHGMLLDDALKSNTYINYLFKILTLKVYNIFLKNVYFLAYIDYLISPLRKLLWSHAGCECGLGCSLPCLQFVC